jgi:hypothetical protein
MDIDISALTDCVVNELLRRFESGSQRRADRPRRVPEIADPPKSIVDFCVDLERVRQALDIRFALSEDVYRSYVDWCAARGLQALAIRFLIGYLEQGYGSTERRRYVICETTFGPHTVLAFGGPGASTQSKKLLGSEILKFRAASLIDFAVDQGAHVNSAFCAGGRADPSAEAKS